MVLKILQILGKRGTLADEILQVYCAGLCNMFLYGKNFHHDFTNIFSTAVDEQNAQTAEQTRLLQGTSGSSLDLVEPFKQCGLQAGSPNSRSAPSFSVFTSDTQKSPELEVKQFDPGKNSSYTQVYIISKRNS